MRNLFPHREVIPLEFGAAYLHLDCVFNVLSLGQGHVISLPQNLDANRAMRRAGLTVHEIDLSEIIKSGGSFRCITLPLCRSDK